MNTLPVTIEKVVVEPWQQVDDERCCWQVKVLTNCYGQKEARVLEATTKKVIDIYKPGYTWEE